MPDAGSDAGPVSSHTVDEDPAGGQIGVKRLPLTRQREGILETTGQAPRTLRNLATSLNHILHQGIRSGCRPTGLWD